MQHVAYRDSNSYTNGQHLAGEKVRVVLMLANTLDCVALSEVLNRHLSIEVIVATADVEFGFARCGSLRPQVLVLDPKIDTDVVQRAAEMIRLREVGQLLVLDDRLHEGRLTAILRLPNVSYLTRQAGVEPLLAGIIQIARTGDRSFDPGVQPRLRKDSGGFHLERRTDRPSVASLTNRELQVMKLLAGGKSVRNCAEHLELAESTIDNHKSRLMKKLNIHKVVELTHVAIREGLIVV